MGAETEGSLLPKQVGEVDKFIDVSNLYVDHEIKEEMVIGPVVLQTPGSTCVGISVIKVLVGDDTIIREEAFGRLNMTRVDGDHSGVQHAGSSDKPYKLNVTVDVVKVEESLAGARPNSENDDHGILDTNHLQRDDPSLPRERSIKGARSSEDQFHCEICLKQFSQKNYLQKHLVIHSGKKPFSCDICKKQFTQKFSLKTHLIIHTYEKPFSCDICNKQFNRKVSLKRHSMIHTNEKGKPFSCDICNKLFPKKDSLKTHVIIHMKRKPFPCDICKKRFSRNDSLNRHLVIHTKEKTFSCDICNKRFHEKRVLKTHFMLHTKEKPFTCDICNKLFSQKSYLKRHFNKSHGRESFLL